MLWAYDKAIQKDLESCIDPQGKGNSNVRVMGEEGLMGIFGQIQEDRITFPALYLDRDSETPLDQTRYNFTLLHKGIPCIYDPEKNNIYLEKSIPIKLGYDLHVLTTNTADMDEVIRELLFRYPSMYYISMTIPYESKRKIRFGIAIDPDTEIERKSGSSQYIEGGTLYESIIRLNCQGAVYLHYTPRHMERFALDPNVKLK